MSGKSQREKEAERQLNQQRQFQQDLTSGKYNVRNRWNNYQNPFDYNQIVKNINDIFGNYQNNINRNTAEAIANRQQGATSQLASRGITGGSILSDTLSGIASDINKTQADALSQLGIGQSQQTAGLQQYFNQLGMQQNQQAQNVDLSNMSNLLSSLMGSYQLNQGQLQNLSDSTFLDDLFGGLSMGAGILSIPTTGGTSLLGTLLSTLGGAGAGAGAGALGGKIAMAAPAIAASDLRLKENLVKVGQKNNINIYHFNYKNNPKKYKGVIAQEVEQIYPEAVKEINNIKYVDYSKIGIEFREI